MNETEVLAVVVGLVITYVLGIGTIWFAIKRVLGSGARLLLATSKAVEDNRVTSAEIELVGQKLQTFSLNLWQLIKAVFGR